MSLAHPSDRTPRRPLLRIKVCCIRSPEEIRLAVSAGVDALGLVAQMPSGPGTLTDEAIASLSPFVPPGVDSFLLTARSNAIDILAHHQRCSTTVLQLVDHLPDAELATLRSRRPPGVRLVPVVHVESEASVAEAQRVAAWADALLLDSGRPGLAVKELGGTGRVHDWRVSARIVTSVDRPVWLAGGLRPENVAEAVRTVRPFGVDVCTGVRDRDGHLDQAALHRFVDAARGA